MLSIVTQRIVDERDRIWEYDISQLSRVDGLRWDKRVPMCPTGRTD